MGDEEQARIWAAVQGNRRLPAFCEAQEQTLSAGFYKMLI